MCLWILLTCFVCPVGFWLPRAKIRCSATKTKSNIHRWPSTHSISSHNGIYRSSIKILMACPAVKGAAQSSSETQTKEEILKDKKGTWVPHFHWGTGRVRLEHLQGIFQGANGSPATTSAFQEYLVKSLAWTFSDQHPDILDMFLQTKHKMLPYVLTSELHKKQLHKWKITGTELSTTPGWKKSDNRRQ